MTINEPVVSVVMSVYNSENFLDEAIKSILNQTFADFEFIIIDDGSTDRSRQIIEGFGDPRIRLLKQSNKGLSEALNRGVAESKGHYIARMDGDDISEPNRLEMQVTYLNNNSGCDIVATRVAMIDELGLPLDDWAEDAAFVTDKQIREYLPISNCIAHPSIMARAEIFKNNPYRHIHASEDYELWMRLVAQGHTITKIPQKLLKYRVYDASVTQTANQSSVTIKLLRTKLVFLFGRIKRGDLGIFDFKVAHSIAKTFFRVAIYRAKKIAVMPLAWIERINMKVPRLDEINKPRVLFLVPWLNMGGADKVLLDLVGGLNKYEHIFLTTEPSSNTWDYRFVDAGATVVHVPKYVRFRQNYARFIEKFVTTNEIQRVIISNSLVGYQSAPLLKSASSAIKIIDILHGQGGKIDQGSAPRFSYSYRAYLDDRVTVTTYLRNYMHDTYDLKASGFTVIPNGINLTPQPSLKRGLYRKKLKIASGSVLVAWIGRFSDEKKPMLALEAARRVCSQTDNVFFVLAGGGPQQHMIKSYIAEHKLTDRIILLGQIEDPFNLTFDSDIVLMTSEMEGFPLVLVEAQSIGIPVVASKVGGIQEIVLDKLTGVLVEYDRNSVVNFAQAIVTLANDSVLRKSYADEAKKTADRFAMGKMIEAYEKIID